MSGAAPLGVAADSTFGLTDGALVWVGAGGALAVEGGGVGPTLPENATFAGTDASGRPCASRSFDAETGKRVDDMVALYFHSGNTHFLRWTGAAWEEPYASYEAPSNLLDGGTRAYRVSPRSNPNYLGDVVTLADGRPRDPFWVGDTGFAVGGGRVVRAGDRTHGLMVAVPPSIDPVRPSVRAPELDDLHPAAMSPDGSLVLVSHPQAASTADPLGGQFEVVRTDDVLARQLGGEQPVVFVALSQPLAGARGVDWR